MKYYESLSGSKREQLFAWMRETDARGQRHDAAAQRLAPGPGEIAAGAAGFDELMKAVTIREYLTGLRQGMTPAETLGFAVDRCTDIVRSHNEKRPKDVNWQRWIGTGTDRLQRLHRSVLAALSA